MRPTLAWSHDLEPAVLTPLLRPCLCGLSWPIYIAILGVECHFCGFFRSIDPTASLKPCGKRVQCLWVLFIALPLDIRITAVIDE